MSPVRLSKDPVAKILRVTIHSVYLRVTLHDCCAPKLLHAFRVDTRLRGDQAVPYHDEDGCNP